MAIRNRRQAREAALRALYQVEIGGSSPNEAVRDLKELAGLSEDVAEFAERLARGVRENKIELDSLIGPALVDWTLDRVPPVDRNVMRIGLFELYHCPEIPPAVSLNEAVEMAKKYGTADSGKFVNGVLGRLLQDSPKANWDPQMAPEDEVEESAPSETPDIEETTVQADSPEAEELAKVGLWKLRSEKDPQ